MNFLAVDIGNTNSVIGLFARESREADYELRSHWRIETRHGATSDEYCLLLSGLMRGVVEERNPAWAPPRIDGAVIS